MTEARFDRESKYRAAIAVAREMLNNKIISADDYSKIAAFFMQKYNPFFAENL